MRFRFIELEALTMEVERARKKKREWAGFRDRTTIGGGGDASLKLWHGGHELRLREREHSRGGSDRPLSPLPIPMSPPPPLKRWSSSSDRSFCLGLVGVYLMGQAIWVLRPWELFLILSGHVIWVLRPRKLFLLGINGRTRVHQWKSVRW